MNPIQLTIKGLYSYQEKQTIDFTRLTGANLFGIFGVVGSGKSSILEAITFAIYGKTDRLNLNGDNRNYNMMNLKSNELLIDFVFETGIPGRRLDDITTEQLDDFTIREDEKTGRGTVYRAVVSGKRNSRNFDDVKALERKAYVRVNEEWQPIGVENLEKAIGLSYENFKRTIIIPQGQFQEFLQLGNRDRTQMMKELFNLGKFEFFYKVTSLESKNNAKRQTMKGQLQQLGELDPEALKQMEEQLEQLRTEIEEKSKTLKEYQNTAEQLRQLQELTTKLMEAEKSVKELQFKEPDFLILEVKIARYEQCLIHFKHQLDSLKGVEGKNKIRQQQIQKDQEKLRVEEEEIGRITFVLEKLRIEYENREELKQKAVELNYLLKIKELEAIISAEKTRLINGNEICANTIEKLQCLKSRKDEKEEQIKAERDSLPDMAILSEVKAWYVGKRSLENQLVEIQKELEKGKQREIVLQDEINRILKADLFREALLINLENGLDYLKEKTGEVKEKIRKLEIEESHLKVRLKIQDYAENLKEGEPCPICGALSHPNPFKPQDIIEEQNRLSTLRQGYENQIEEITLLEKKLNTLGNEIHFFQCQQKEWIQKQLILEKRIKDHASLFIWERYQEEAELNRAFQEAEQIQQTLKKNEAELGELAKNIVQEELKKERYREEVDKINKALTIHQTELSTLAGQLKLVDQEIYKAIQEVAIKREISSLSEQYNNLEKSYTCNSNLLSERTKVRDQLKGSLETNQRELEAELLEIRKIREQLEGQLERSAFSSLEEVKQILADPIQVELERQKLTQFKDQLSNGKHLLEKMRMEIGEGKYDIEKHQLVNQQIQRIGDLLQERNQNFGKTTVLYRKLQQDLETQGKLQEDLSGVEQRAENIRTMKSLFTASGFVNYISSVYLQNLCNAANDRFFQLTRQKLSLEITSDNNFQVRDFMNGGKVRSVKTLSGGQTFQAALSLALALADNIQKITESNQNFFFLDEGFGSLDKESLAVVFDTLKSLRRENRVVGVISHVEEMQQEIDVHLRIENDEEKGSRIFESWKN